MDGTPAPQGGRAAFSTAHLFASVHFYIAIFRWRTYSIGTAIAARRNMQPATDTGCWGKTWRRRSPATVDVHRLEHHCLDVLAALDALIARDPGLLTSIAHALEMERTAALRLLRWCALLHDAGKVAKAFQGKSRTGWKRLRGDAAMPRDLPCAHDMVGFKAIMRKLEDDGTLDREGAEDVVATVVAAAFFHHGRPRAVSDHFEFGEYSEASDAPKFARMVDGTDTLVGRPEWPTLGGAQRASWLLTGIVSLVDGLGSAVSDRIMEKAETVPPEWLEGGTIKAVDWADYLSRVARPIADAVVGLIGSMAFIPLAPPPERDDREVLAAMAGSDDPASFIPSPLQTETCRVALNGGKTEASAMLVRRAIRAKVAEGGYWGLPTMATANGLYRRFMHISPLLHGGDHSLVLAHGANDDMPLFRAALRDTLGNPISSSQDAKDTHGATCLDWLVEGSHRSLLAHCGVGTIDQALFAGLNSYHCGIRWVGLHRKVLVADEVHAADPGMLEILCAVLRHLAALGGSAVMMSATLPSVSRRMLLDAFSSGTGWPTPGGDLNQTAYPLLTVRRSDGTTEIPVATRPDRYAASHRIIRISSEDQALECLTAWSAADKCAVWFRNTVPDAIGAYRTLRERGVPVLLFHSRFTRARRAVIEGGVIDRFGPESGGDKRAGWVLVSTQVAEQSLDIDFDEQVLDLAPADLILQRLGRRRRHIRHADGLRKRDGLDERPDECVRLLSPDENDVRDCGWLKELLPGTAFVYPNTARLWLSAKLLLHPEAIPNRLPGSPSDLLVPHLDARPLVEAVYPPDDWSLRAVVPEPLRKPYDRDRGETRMKRDDSIARAFAFKDGYLHEAQRIAGDFEDASAMTATRSGDGGTVHLAVERDGRWGWLETGGMMQSSVPVRLNMRPHNEASVPIEEIAYSLEQALESRLLSGEDADRARREVRLLRGNRPPTVVAMRPDGDGLLAGFVVAAGDGATYLVTYDGEFGLQTKKLR